MMKPSEYAGLTRITKRGLNTLFVKNIDIPVIITSDKVSPFSTMAFHTTACAEKRKPVRMLNEFYYYNCDKERGHLICIYISDENYKALREQGVKV